MTDSASVGCKTGEGAGRGKLGKGDTRSVTAVIYSPRENVAGSSDHTCDCGGCQTG